MKKVIVIALSVVLIAAGAMALAQTPASVLENAERKLLQLLTKVGLVPITQGGIAERIDGHAAQLLAAPSPPPSTPSDVVCAFGMDCAPAIQKALDAAADGGSVTLPAGQHLVSSAIRIYKPVHLKGQGRFATVLMHKQNIGWSGTGGVFHISKHLQPSGVSGTLSGVTFSDFQIKGDRAVNPGMRTSAMRFYSRVSNLIIRDMHFEQITSNCITGNGVFSSNIVIVNNSANEYYEQFVELSLQHSSDALIAGNTVKTTSGHPSLNTIEPFPVSLTPGHAGNHSGVIDRVWIVNNIFDHRGMSSAERGNTVGVQLSQDQASLGYQFGFQNVHVVGNKMYGVGRGVRVQLFRTSTMPSDPHSMVTVEQNEFRNFILGFEPIWLEGRATVNDLIFVGRNFFDLQTCGACQPYKLNTVATILKYSNRCLKSGVNYDCN